MTEPIQPGRRLDALIAKAHGKWISADRSYADGEPLQPYSVENDCAIPLLLPYYNAGCSAWIELDGHTGIRAGVTSRKGRFEHEGVTIAHAICLAVLAEKSA